jgi:hypothetical protein
MDALEQLAQRLAGKLTPDATPGPEPVQRRWGTIAAVNADGTYNVALAASGVTLPSLRALGYGAFTAGEVVVVDFTGSDPLVMGAVGTPDGSHTVGAELQAGWSNYGDPWRAKYRKVHGIVLLEGLVTGGATSTAMLSLPAGYRPGHSTMRTQMAAGPAVVRVDYYTDGSVYLTAEMVGARTAGGWVSVATSFAAEL